VASVEARSTRCRVGSVCRKFLEVRHDRLHGAQLQEHIVGLEDFAHEGPDVWADALGALFPVALAPVP
jgi:hypothetical protein